MNKQEAADYLGVSTRAIERYTQKGKLSVKYENAKTRPVAVYDQAELDRLKDELNIVNALYKLCENATGSRIATLAIKFRAIRIKNKISNDVIGITVTNFNVVQSI
ncbi:hypothetical protein PCC7424_5608 (plasmid) [Gloeothece citriformis PCC 7424]|uniref:HTH merR-type domain-containing protein n=1 Tax=Gloeothece citriformis (strain PCC 7424) TaxID=65393 RepID=B7KMZ5_GLOC7|nr:MerR family transcriptional regulator [Gloeothece citriformis]ACK74167.1 hypothetical protein PCC7424_5608 [Gloeothece citriformis PCC 7424]